VRIIHGKIFLVTYSTVPSTDSSYTEDASVNKMLSMRGYVIDVMDMLLMFRICYQFKIDIVNVKDMLSMRGIYHQCDGEIINVKEMLSK
jgi:hypothetical protein